MTVNIDNIQTNCLCLGEKSDEAVVMLHGWASNGELFRNSALPVSAKYLVLAPDMPGNGATPEPPFAWSVDDYVDFVIHFIEHFGLKKVILLGHSFGGRVIIKMANRNDLPFEITRIILVDSAGIRPEKSSEQKLKENVSKFGKKLLSKTPALLDKMQTMVGSADYRAASPLMRQVLVNTVNEDLTGLLPGIMQETLLIWGTLDTATPISDAEKMEKLIPNAGLARIEGCGHFSFIENPVIYNAVLASFLKL
ncbi:MAG: alpha/beta hydrolase [Clostridia bacterium]|nr:alpha/beta hydrolase [Clostridia bacterium]